MTQRTRCRDIERLMLEAEQRALTGAERRLVEEHTRACANCRDFASDRATIRAGLGTANWPEPPDDLVRRTRRLMRQAGAAKGPAPLPAWVLVALAMVAIATGIWAAVSLADVTADTTLADLPLAARAAVFVIVQNAVTLLFAPVVLRAFRAGRGVPAKVG
ncbi:MAG TPA: zf-HC2 domain-containing protein [Candidatus Aminicenantes bacterium]|nr:zf-HC2 domain-containing protein [Candidatus Aminicenantes bacterium]HDT13930.1 zf-HC2 domain-containing protein [Candidatus Aminicenantes bacterium]